MNTLPELSRPRGAVLMERHDDVALGELLRHGDVINRFAMQKTERRVGLRIFGRWIGFESATSQRQIETLQLKAGRLPAHIAALPSTPEKLQWRTPALFALTAMLSAAATMLLREPAMPDRDGAMIVTTLKPPLPLIVPPGSIAPRHDVRPLAARPLRPAAPLQSPASTAPAGSPSKDPADQPTTLAADAGIAPQSTLQQARALALSTNEPAFWAEGPRRGVVVVGRESPENGKLCRNIVVFTRVNEDGGRSETTHSCRAMAAVPRATAH